jgi:hypothetical protein
LNHSDNERNYDHTPATSSESSIKNKLESDSRISSISPEMVAPMVTEVSAVEGQNFAEAGRIVNDWESKHCRLWGRNKEVASRTAMLQLKKKRGLTRQDLQDWYNLSTDYARRKIYLLRKRGLLVEITGRRTGKFKQYCISTESDNFKASPQSIASEPFAINGGNSFIQNLAAELIRKKPSFHKLFLYTNIPKDLYGPLKWTIRSPKNKAKVEKFPIDFRRWVEFSITPDGTTTIMLSSTANPYELHNPDGLVDFFAALGNARGILQSSCNEISRIPKENSWKLKMFDRDKTIPISELEKQTPQINGWWSDEGVTVQHLGEAFQIYGKMMPISGAAFRIENQTTVKESKKNVTGTILDAAFPEITFKSALEELQDLRKRIERLEGSKPSEL